MDDYQSFGPRLGSSDSLRKLQSLALPPLKGKAVLDVGCNEGFFCFHAEASGATFVEGIDASEEYIRRARGVPSQVRFQAVSWDEWVPDRQYDLILLLSALHYAADPKTLIDKLTRALTRNGVLVLEMSIVEGAGARWETVKRSIDERLFPTRDAVEELLASYAFKIIGRSVRQEGDPSARWVIHCKRKLPYLFALFGDSNSGKSTLSRYLGSKLAPRIISFDQLYLRLAVDKPATHASLVHAVGGFDPLTEGHLISARIFDSPSLRGSFIDYLRLAEASGDVVLDGYVPERLRGHLLDSLSERGFFCVSVNGASHPPSGQPNCEVLMLGDRYYFASSQVKVHVDSVTRVDTLLRASGWCVVSGQPSWARVFARLGEGEWFEVTRVERIQRPDLVRAGWVTASDGEGAGFNIAIEIPSAGTGGVQLAFCDGGVMSGIVALSST